MMTLAVNSRIGIAMAVASGIQRRVGEIPAEP